MKQDKKSRFGIRKFFRGKAGRNFLLFMEFLLLVAFFARPDLYYDPTAPTFMMKFYADSLTICGGLWVLLVFLTVKKFNISEETGRKLTWAAGVLTPFVCFLWLEFYNHAQFWVPVFRIPVLYLTLDLIIYYVIFLLLLVVVNSIRNASILMVLLTSFFGIMNYELTLFRGMSFIASDIYSFLTALSVSNTYRIQIDVDTAEFFMLTLVLCALLFKLESDSLFKWKGRIVFSAAWILLFGVFCRVYVTSDYLKNIGVDFRVYHPQFKYRFYGTLLTTVRTFGYLHVKEPEGYSLKAVEDVIADYEGGMTPADTGTGGSEPSKNTAGKKPNIIVVMNESFADLKELGDLEVSEDYMPFFRKLKKNTIKGYTYSSVFGGNTANSEFEFLTGNTLAFLPDNSVPYQLFLRSEVPGLTYTLKDQGYKPALALHPYYSTGYSRYKIYPLMGFDQFYTSNNFSVFSDTVNYHITDFEDYKKIISLYENSRRSGSEDPFYMFNVTMQNHGSYDGNTFETGDEVKLEGRFRYYYKTEQFLNMIKMSDDALKYLVQYFSDVDEPTVIVFFGDHQPDLEEYFYNALLGTNIQDLEGESLEQLYKVPFLIWANYDIPEETVERTSNNYLTTWLAQITGMEQTGYLGFLTRLREEIPCINAIGYWGKDGKFYETGDRSSPYYDLIHQYNLLEYNNIFGKDKRQDSFFFLEGHRRNE
ncbi:MAG: LTA synthase family protein [Eubacterium sp.]|nr:LTA synthase family protein [Eubacterium sp.]